LYLKPQDVLVLLKLSVWGDRLWRQEDLAGELGMVQSQVYSSLKRADECGLYKYEDKHVNKAALVEIVVHAVRFLVPGSLGPRTRGMPTAWGHRGAFACLASGVFEPPVWPIRPRSNHPFGLDSAVDGVAVEPLHEKAPGAAMRDPKLYELLAAIDAMRIGRARDLAVARDLIRHRLLSAV